MLRSLRNQSRETLLFFQVEWEWVGRGKEHKVKFMVGPIGGLILLALITTGNSFDKILSELLGLFH